jgi:hypothetical protein
MATSNEKGAAWSMTMTAEERLMLHMVSDYHQRSAAEFVRDMVRREYAKIAPDHRDALLKRAEIRGRK